MSPRNHISNWWRQFRKISTSSGKQAMINHYIKFVCHSLRGTSRWSDIKFTAVADHRSSGMYICTCQPIGVTKMPLNPNYQVTILDFTLLNISRSQASTSVFTISTHAVTCSFHLSWHDNTISTCAASNCVLCKRQMFNYNYNAL